MLDFDTLSDSITYSYTYICLFALFHWVNIPYIIFVIFSYSVKIITLKMWNNHIIMWKLLRNSAKLPHYLIKML